MCVFCEPNKDDKCKPLQLKMVNGSHSMWVPSVNDCLSNDWAITD